MTSYRAGACRAGLASGDNLMPHGFVGVPLVNTRRMVLVDSASLVSGGGRVLA